MKVLVGSANPVKIDAVREAFSNYFSDPEILGFETDSGVSPQPVDQETYLGARNRANKLVVLNSNKNLNGDFFIGIEGGIIKVFDKWFALGVMCIINNDGLIGFGSSPMFELPESVILQLLDGKELGEVMDEITGDENTKRKGGAIGYLTNGIMDRKNLYISGIIAAMAPFNHKNLFFKDLKRKT